RRSPAGAARGGVGPVCPGGRPAMRTLVPLLSIVLMATPALAQSAGGPPVKEVGIEQRLGERIPLDLSFTGEDGRPVKLGGYFGERPVVLVLAYYRCPMLCTMVLNGLVEGLRGVSFDAGKEFSVVVVSFDPRELPELAAAKKASYVASYGRPHTAAGWHFLTGSEPNI